MKNINNKGRKTFEILIRKISRNSIFQFDKKRSIKKYITLINNNIRKDNNDENDVGSSKPFHTYIQPTKHS